MALLIAYGRFAATPKIQTTYFSGVPLLNFSAAVWVRCLLFSGTQHRSPFLCHSSKKIQKTCTSLLGVLLGFNLFASENLVLWTSHLKLNSQYNLLIVLSELILLQKWRSLVRSKDLPLLEVVLAMLKWLFSSAYNPYQAAHPYLNFCYLMYSLRP
jgi:hypothetical protein